jgi:hypothetical protein
MLKVLAAARCGLIRYHRGREASGQPLRLKLLCPASLSRRGGLR